MPYQYVRTGVISSSESGLSYDVILTDENPPVTVEDVNSLFPFDYYPPGYPAGLGYPATGNPLIVTRGISCHRPFCEWPQGGREKSRSSSSYNAINWAGALDFNVEPEYSLGRAMAVEELEYDEDKFRDFIFVRSDLLIT